MVRWRFCHKKCVWQRRVHSFAFTPSRTASHSHLTHHVTHATRPSAPARRTRRGRRPSSVERRRGGGARRPTRARRARRRGTSIGVASRRATSGRSAAAASTRRARRQRRAAESSRGELGERAASTRCLRTRRAAPVGGPSGSGYADQAGASGAAASRPKPGSSTVSQRYVRRRSSDGPETKVRDWANAQLDEEVNRVTASGAKVMQEEVFGPRARSTASTAWSSRPGSILTPSSRSC